MSFIEHLAEATADERARLYESPIIVDALAGQITRPQYVAFLKEAYFHVSQTVPLLMACGARLTRDYEWLRKAVAHYIDEEYGHEAWVLNDIRAAGGDADAIRDGSPSPATEFMVSYAWYTIQRGNPAGFFGMVYVLEGTSVALATEAAETLQRSLNLPPKAFSYLLSHGSIDQAHVRFLEDLVNRFDRDDDRAAVVHGARRFFRLYADLFRTLPDAAAALARAELRAVA